MSHTETLLFIDDDEAEPLEFDGFGQQGVGADDDVDITGGQAFARLFGFCRRNQPRKAPNFYRKGPKALFEIVKMLASEQRRWCNYGNLHPGHGSSKGGAHRHLGFAKANIAADQAIHRLAGGHVAKHFLNRLLLIIRFLIRETIHKAGHFASFDASGSRRLQGTRSSGPQQLMGNRPDAFLQLGLTSLPAFATEAIQHHAIPTFAVTAENVYILDRYVKLVAAGIFQMDAIMRAGANRNRDYSFVQTDTVFQMDHQITLTERRKFFDEGVTAFAPFGFADQPVAKNVLFGEERQVIGAKTRGER